MFAHGHQKCLLRAGIEFFADQRHRIALALPSQANQFSTLGFKQHIVDEGTPQLACGRELVDAIRRQIEAGTAVASKADDAGLFVAGALQADAFDQRLGLGQ